MSPAGPSKKPRYLAMGPDQDIYNIKLLPSYLAYRDILPKFKMSRYGPHPRRFTVVCGLACFKLHALVCAFV